MSAWQRARASESPAAAAVATFTGCAAADLTLPCYFAALPLPVALSIFALLPADARARASAVCSSWCWQLTAGPSSWQLWMELDLSETSGVMCALSDAVLEGAAALARGRLRTLKLRNFDVLYEDHLVSDEALLRVVSANTRLEELTFVRGDDEFTRVEQVQALLNVAPALQRLSTNVQTKSIAVARALLRREPPYAAVDLRYLFLGDYVEELPHWLTSDDVIAFAADVAACESLQEMNLSNAILEAPAALEALVDAVLTRGLRSLHLRYCRFTPATALPQLARLLTDGRTELTDLFVSNSETLFRTPENQPYALTNVGTLGDALAQASKLTGLELTNVGLTQRECMLTELLLRRAVAARPASSPSGPYVHVLSI